MLIFQKSGEYRFLSRLQSGCTLLFFFEIYRHRDGANFVAFFVTAPFLPLLDGFALLQSVRNTGEKKRKN